MAGAVRRTPPMAKKAPGDSEAAGPRWARIVYVGSGQIVKAAVGAVLTLELTRATRLPACLRAFLIPFRPASLGTWQPRPRQSRSCRSLCPNGADNSSRRRASAPVSRCSSAGKTAGASNSPTYRCALRVAGLTSVGQLLPAQSQAPLLQPCALCSSARKART